MFVVVFFRADFKTHRDLSLGHGSSELMRVG